MNAGSRQDARAGDAEYDLIVVGGGIYGAMLALEASRRSLRCLLLERDDFGAGTTANNLRIVHGGLRYLQSADLPRFVESVQERRWFLREFADLVTPLGCLMPLHGEGVRRRALMGPAMWLNDGLGFWRNRGLSELHRLPAGRLLSSTETTEGYPGVRRPGLKGAACWFDAFAPHMGRLVIEIVRWAQARGAECQNYCEVLRLETHRGKVRGVVARAERTGEERVYSAPVVVNAAGPASRAFAAAHAPEEPSLFIPALAWNVVYDRPAPSPHALAVAPPGSGGQVLFVVPWHGRMLAGTGHVAWHGEGAEPAPSGAELDAFTTTLNAAMPGMDLTPGCIERVFSGLLPTTAPGHHALTKRPVFVDHGESGGPGGFYSVSGVKFTTARRVADRALARVFPARVPRDWNEMSRPQPTPQADWLGDRAWGWMPKPHETEWLDGMMRVARAESVEHLDDLVVRRSTLGDRRVRGLELAPRVADRFDWSAGRREREIERVRRALAPRIRRPGADGSPAAQRTDDDGHAARGDR